ncbi:MAG: acyl-CoA synthetase [Polyangiaceae bacterium]|nr:acyl-CoA synthetase [Polyangiaceae bacterium]
MSSSALLARFVQHKNNEKPAIVDGVGAHAYSKVVLDAGRVALALLEGHERTGSLQGERVAILVSPGAAFVAAFFGVLLAGGCVVVLSPLHPAPETRYFCDDAGVKTVLVSGDLSAFATPLASAFRVRDVASILAQIQGVGAYGHTPLPDFVTTQARAISEDKPALQLYTSGTTGKPKGAVITHANLAVQQKLVGSAWGFSAQDTLLHVLPLHHMHGLCIALLTALGSGATVRMMPFDAARVWEAMDHATVFMAVPAMYHRLFLAFDAADEHARSHFAQSASRLRLATSGSAALPVTLAERWRALTNVIPLERFGMTEIGVGLSNRLLGDRYPGSVGFPLPTVETRIVDEAGAKADVGELWIRGPSVFVGYHNKPQATAEAFAPDPAGGPPWFRTGDTVTRDTAAGNPAPFKILGRTSVDILKSGGYKLSALEIEEVLREHACVLEVAVVGVPDEAWGDRVVACVVLRCADSERPACDAQALRAFAKEKLASYKVPKDVLFLQELPKNTLGKVLKPQLAQQALKIVFAAKT